MVEKFNIWAESIVVAIAITTIIEMLLPEGNNKKYIKIVCSIYILFTIINPIINLSKENFNIKNISEKEVINTFNYDNFKIANVYIEAYEDEIKNELIKRGYNLIDVKIEIDNIGENIENIIIKTYYISEEEKIKLKEEINQIYNIQNININ